MKIGRGKEISFLKRELGKLLKSLTFLEFLKKSPAEKQLFQIPADNQYGSLDFRSKIFGRLL